MSSREALREEFVEDALDAYTEKEQELEGAQPGLMRDVERFVILSVVDQRWRSHLDSMDYLREGVHLRAFAQKDPLVEYRAEGHVLFEELSQTIREEVVLTLFHAQVELQPQEGLQPAAQGGNGNLQYEHETTAGAERDRGCARLRAARAPSPARRRPRRWRRGRRRSSTSTATSAATTRAGAAAARSTRSATAPDAALRQRPRS